MREEPKGLPAVAVLPEDAAEDAESQHLRQHLHPSLRPPKYKHQHRRAMARPRPRPRPRSPTASTLYDPPHRYMADNL